MSPLVPVTLTWPQILKRTSKAAYDDNCLGLAAQLAYYFFLALFPALLFLLAGCAGLSSCSSSCSQSPASFHSS